MDLQGWACGGIAITVALFGLAVVLKQRQNRQRAWQQVAAQHGLSYAASGWPAQPSLTGKYRGRSLVVKTKDNYLAGRHRIVRTDVIVDLKAPIPLTLTVAKKSLLQQAGEGLVSSPRPTGDNFIDHLYDVQGNPPEAALALLRAPALRPLLETTRFINVTLSGASLAYHENELIDDCQALLDYVCDWADAVEALLVFKAA